MPQERIELGLTVFQPQTRPEVDLYRGTADLDKKAEILNRDIIKVGEEAIATPDSVRTVALIVVGEQTGVIQYRSDAVAGLNSENLVAMVNGLSVDEKELIDPLTGAIRRIRSVSENAALQDLGVAPRRLMTKDENLATLEEEVFAELAERLIEDDLDFSERRKLISAIEGLITPQALRKISREPEVLAALLRSSGEFNDDLRFVLKEMQENLEKESNTSGYSVSDSPL